MLITSPWTLHTQAHEAVNKALLCSSVTAVLDLPGVFIEVKKKNLIQLKLLLW